MRNRRKRMQREEVRKILTTMRLELAAQRLVQEQRDYTNSSSTKGINEIITGAKGLVAG